MPPPIPIVVKCHFQPTVVLSDAAVAKHIAHATHQPLHPFQSANPANANAAIATSAAEKFLTVTPYIS